jgi:hypothetical protein
MTPYHARQDPEQGSLKNVDLRGFAILIVSVFLVLTVVSTLKATVTEVLGGDLVPLHYVADVGKLAWFTVRELLFEGAFICLFLITYQSFTRMNFYRPSVGISSKGMDYFFAALSFSLLLMLAFSSTGSISRAESDNRFVDLAFALFQPFYVLIIYFYARQGESRLIHKLTFMFFVVACILSGFTGYLLYIAPFLYSALRGRIGRVAAAILLGFGFTLLPVVRMLKFLYVNGFDKFDVITNDFGKSYLAFMEIVIDRFSFIPNVIFVSDNAEVFRKMMSSEYLPFFQGYVGSLIHKIFAGRTVENINGAVTYMITGLDDSNSTFPLISYFDLSATLGIGVLAYGLIVNTVLMFLLSFALRRERLFFLALVISYTLLVGGWFWPYMNFVQAAVVFLFVHLVNKVLKYVAANAADYSTQHTGQPRASGESHGG